MGLPALGRPLIGREPLVARVRAAVSSGGLVTLHGPGGVGKTSLALAVATAVDRPADFVDLTHARHTADLALTTAAALSLPVQDDPVADVAAWLARQRPRLLILDNFEQLEPAAATAVRDWALGAPTVAILVTSRHVLGDEPVIAVPPLDAEGAATLFRARVPAALAAELDASPDDLTALVQQLEGLPLAIELGAARFEVLGLQGLAQRLDTRLRLLRDPGRTDRHGALRAVLAASWELLDPAEQQQLSAACAFRGGFDADAARGVLDVAPSALDELVGKSLLQRRGDRWDLLESVRDYAREQGSPATDRHAAWYAAASRDWLDHAYRTGSLDRLASERPNLETALAHAAPADRARLAAALGELRDVVGYGVADAAVEVLDDLPAELEHTAVHLDLLRRRMERRWAQHRTDEARADADAQVALARRLDDPLRLAVALCDLVDQLAYGSEDRVDELPALAAEAIAAARATGHPTREGEALMRLGWNIHLERREYAEAIEALQAATLRFDAADVPGAGAMFAHSLLHHAHQVAGSPRAGLAAGHRALAIARAARLHFQVGHCLGMLGLTHALLGDLDDARGYFADGAVEAEAWGDSYWLHEIGVADAVVLGLQGAFEEALDALARLTPRGRNPQVVRAAVLADAGRLDDARESRDGLDGLGAAVVDTLLGCQAARHRLATTGRDAARDVLSGLPTPPPPRTGLQALVVQWAATRRHEVDAAVEGWRVHRGGRWFEAPEGTRQTVIAASEQAVLARLATLSLATFSQLAREAWPQAELHEDVARDRLYVAISRLRNAGVEPIEAQRSQGWRWAVEEPVTLCDEG